MRYLKVVSIIFWGLLVAAYLTGHRLTVVEGTSMLPTIKPNSLILIQPLRFAGAIKVGDIVALRKAIIGDGLMTEERWVKRLVVIKDDGWCFVQGDNRQVSWDTWVNWRDIDGKVYVVANGLWQTLIFFLVLVEMAFWVGETSLLGSVVSCLIKVVKGKKQRVEVQP
jgi:signal peptidase I